MDPSYRPYNGSAEPGLEPGLEPGAALDEDEPTEGEHPLADPYVGSHVYVEQYPSEATQTMTIPAAPLPALPTAAVDETEETPRRETPRRETPGRETPRRETPRRETPRRSERRKPKPDFVQRAPTDISDKVLWGGGAALIFSGLLSWLELVSGVAPPEGLDQYLVALSAILVGYLKKDRA